MENILDELRDALNYVDNYSLFYKKLFFDHDIRIDYIHTREDWAKIPCTTKSDMQKYNDQFLCVDRHQVSDWVTTSGTLGNPISFALTSADLDRLAMNEKQSFSCAGLTAEDSIQLMVTMDKRFMAGLAYYVGGHKLGATMIRVGSGNPGLQLDSIERFNPTVLVAVPSFLVKILEYAQARHIDIARWSVRKVLCIGEPIRTIKLELNNLGKRIKSYCPEWTLIGTYASTEMSTAITECEHGLGGHIPPELIHIELLDDDGNEVADGEEGEVTVTTLGVEAMPLIKYRTGDMCIKYTEVCDCGKSTPRLGPILGRKQQMIKYKGTTLFPNSIYEILNGISYVKDYLVELTSTELDMDDVTIYISCDETKSYDITHLQSVVQDSLRVLPKIKVISSIEMRKKKFPDGSRKPIKIADYR